MVGVQDDQRDPPSTKVLLISDRLVGGNQDIEPANLGCGNQVAVGKLVPAQPPCEGNFMAGEVGS